MKETQKFLNWYINAGLVEDGIIGVKSRMAIFEGIKKLKLDFALRNWVWNDEFNFIGFRTNDEFENTFEDWFVVYTADTLIALPSTTVAGVVGVWKYVNIWLRGKKGVGTIKENQQIDYLLVQPNTSNNWSMWTGGLGFLFQDKPIDVYRGAYQQNGKLYIDKNNLATGDIGGGFNVHSWAGFNIWNVNNLSEGCQTTRQQYWDILFPLLVKNSKNSRVIYSLIQL